VEKPIPARATSRVANPASRSDTGLGGCIRPNSCYFLSPSLAARIRIICVYTHNMTIVDDITRTHSILHNHNRYYHNHSTETQPTAAHTQHAPPSTSFYSLLPIIRVVTGPDDRPSRASGEELHHRHRPQMRCGRSKNPTHLHTHTRARAHARAHTHTVTKAQHTTESDTHARASRINVRIHNTDGLPKVVCVECLPTNKPSGVLPADTPRLWRSATGCGPVCAYSRVCR